MAIMMSGKKSQLKWKNGVCEVESHVDGNKKKKRVFFCTDCRAWLCRDCSGKFGKRAMAMVLRDIHGMGKKLNKKVKF
mgnify:CR=1 FL=1